jgi:hypothetical protein
MFGLVPGFSLESLEEDRKALRNHYMELFARGKKVLDRIRSAGDLKLSTTAIVSSIVARFIYDHADQIKNLIYKDNGLII